MKCAPTTTSLLSVVLGFLTRPCCSLPFFLNLVGAGSSSLALSLMPYRTVFRAASLLALALAGFFIYWRRQNHPINRFSFWVGVFLLIGQWAFFA